MCLIIHKPAGETVPRWVIDSAYISNFDGFGIMAQGKAKKWKSLKPAKIESLLADYTDIETAIHFRMATHGKVNKSNAHPFKLNNRSYLMHNGVLGKYCPTKGSISEKSDTRNFIDTFVNPTISKYGSIPKALLESEILGNKICIMQRDGTINRYGSGWVKHFGLYFSNEYAWESPTYSGYWYEQSEKNGKTYPAYIERDDDIIISDTGYGYNLAQQMVDALQDCLDVLPFNDCSYIAYEDIGLQDELLENEISPNDFLEYCTDETLLHLYTYAVGYGLIQA